MKKLFVVVLLSTLLSTSLLSRGHVWWDDFASYIMQAQSLLHGDTAEFVQRNTFTIQESSYPIGPIAYPWGYPVLLAPVLYFFGVKVLALKLVNTLTYVLFLILFYKLARLRLTENWSLLLTALLAFNPTLLFAHDYILSDIPFLLFSTLSLFLIDWWLSNPDGRVAVVRQCIGTRGQYRNHLLIGVVVFAAFSIRTNGILLLVPLAIAQISQLGFQGFRKNWLTVLLPYFVFALFACMLTFILPGGQESYFTHFSMFTLERFIGNLVYYLKLPAALFDYIPLGIVFFIFTVILFFIGAGATWCKNLHLLAYIILTLLLFMLWPETQGIRFIFPILPLFILIAAQGAIWLGGKISQPVFVKAAFGIWLAVSILSFGVSAWSGWTNIQSGREINGPFDSISSDMFEFIRKQTPPDSVIIFFKPRAMHLFTDRDSFMTENCEGLTKGDYLVIHEKQGSNGQLTQQAAEACGVPLESIFNNKRFTVYKISP
jgi:hypothetical protein